MENEIVHSSHEHPLKLGKKAGKYYIQCRFCWQLIYSAPYYYCTKGFNVGCRDFFLHKWCAELPSEMIHPFHSYHPLVLDQRRSFRCDACRRISWASSFRCSLCDFDLDLPCASLIPDTGGHQGPSCPIQLLSPQPHALIACQNTSDLRIYCSSCKLRIGTGTSVYVCLDCRCLLDESCAKLAPEMDHPFHPQHPLRLLFQFEPSPDSSRCRACGEVLEGFIFHCAQCGFRLDVRCASLSPAGHKVERLSHPHSLTRCRKTWSARLACDGCGLKFLDPDPVYMCFECCLLLHRSCADLPRVVNNGLYHQHQLALLERSLRHQDDPFETTQLLLANCHPNNPESPSGWAELACRVKNKFKFRCRACHQSAPSGFSYACVRCSFYLDLTCPVSEHRLIQSELHPPHPLAFFQVLSEYGLCNVCSGSFHAPFFRCIRCNFNLHVKCVPGLPPTIKTRRHRHPLTLTDSPVKDRPGDGDDDDDDDEFICDACEKTRTLNDRSYYCQECNHEGRSFVAHIDCVVDEILTILENELPSSVSETLKIEELEEQEVAAAESQRQSRPPWGMRPGQTFVDLIDMFGSRNNPVPVVNIDEEINLLNAKLQGLARDKEASEGRLKELQAQRALLAASSPLLPHEENRRTD